jgi:hypothetical protein
MDQVAAGTLAQVIPVIGLALGLEMRTQGDSARTSQEARLGQDLIALLSVAVVSSLGILEVIALDIVVGSPKEGFPLGIMILDLCVIAAFMIPAFSLMAEVFLRGHRSNARRTLLMIFGGIVFLLMMVVSETTVRSSR